MVLRLLRQRPVRRRVRSDPREALPCAAGLLARRLGEAEHRRQQQPLAPAVVRVATVAVDAAAGTDELGADLAHDVGVEGAERWLQQEVTRVEPLAGYGLVGRAAHRGSGLRTAAPEPERDRAERGGVDALALLPPVDARLAPDALEVVGGDLRGRLVGR